MSKKNTYQSTFEELGWSLRETLDKIEKHGETKELKYEMLLKYGRLKLMEGNLNEAYQIFQQCSTHSIDNWIPYVNDLYYWTARCLEEQGNKERAFNAYLMVLDKIKVDEEEELMNAILDRFHLFENVSQLVDEYKKKKKERMNNPDELLDKFVKVLRQTYPKSITVCDSSEDFYDKMFEELIESSPFLMPQYDCVVTEKKEVFASEKNLQGAIASHAFLWFRNIYKQNLKLYKHIFSLANKGVDQNLSEEDKKIIIEGTLGNVPKQIFSDSNALNAIFSRVSTYLSLIKRQTNGFFSFYSEHGNKDDIEYFLSRANNDFVKTINITDIARLEIFDIDIIFLRDMLGGKNLTEKN
jgi:tetratricopeptide (TPR) repeat protein